MTLLMRHPGVLKPNIFSVSPIFTEKFVDSGSAFNILPINANRYETTRLRH